MRRTSIVLLVTLLCASVAAQQTGQEPSSAVTFRSEANFVEVHAIVTDKSGAFVRDLSPDDFEILEDGRPQRVSTFSLIDLPVERPPALAGSTEAIEPDVKSTTRTFDGRIYLLVLDDLHTMVTRTQLVRDAARKFIQTYLGTNDLAAVVYTSGRSESGQELTNNQRLLLAAINRFQGQKLPSAGAEKLAIHVRESALDQANNSDGESSRPRTSEGLTNALNIKDPYEQQRALNARRMLDTIRFSSNWLRDVQGRRKALLLFSEGIDYDIYQPFFIATNSGSLLQDARDAAAAAQRANVNVYGIDPRGLNQFGELAMISQRSDYPQLDYGTFRGALRELRLSQESLMSLADETGGLAIVNQGDVIGGLGRIVLDNSRYYLIGYSSDATRWSRKFMKIDVRVKRPGVEVRARRGFMPPDPKEAAETRALDAKAGTSPALRAALAKPVPIGDLPFRVFAAPFRSTAKEGSLVLALEFDGPALRFKEADGRFNEKIEVSIVAADHRARVQGGDRQEFDLRLQPQTHQRVSQNGVRLLSRLPLPPGRYQIRVGAYETSGGATGTVPYDVEIPDYGKTPFTMSGVLLTSSRADAMVTPNPDPALKDLLPAVPVATRRFGADEMLATYVEVYSNRDAGAVNVTSSILDARDGRKVLESTDRQVPGAGDVGQGFSTTLRLAGLPSGPYVLRVDARSASGGHTARRDIPFEVR